MKNILPIFILFFLIGCNQADDKMKNDLHQKLETAEEALKNANLDETAFIHTVFFWMNENVTDNQKDDFIKNGLGKLTKISTIYKSYYGPPAMTPREVVDNTYDFALVCHFKNKEDQDKYQEDPTHLKFIEEYKDLWKRVQVYDNLVIK